MTSSYNWEREKARWAECRRCSLGQSAFRHVWGEGRWPCDVLIVGEAPGVSEDALGRPFVGPSGQLLREAIAMASSQRDGEIRVFLSNLLACAPYTDPGNPRSVRAPTSEEIASCAPRLQWICSQSGARKILLLGALPGSYRASIRIWAPRVQVETFEHPAYALRRGGTAKSEWVEKLQRWISAD